MTITSPRATKLKQLCLLSLLFIGACSSTAQETGKQVSSEIVTADEIQLTLENNTDYDWYYVYVSDTDDNNWGQDQLGEEIMAAGGIISMPLTPSTYDLRIEDEDGDICQEFGIEIQDDMTFSYDNNPYLECISETNNSAQSTASSGTVPFVITNNSSGAIHYIYFSRTDEDWGGDHLGSIILEPDKSFTINTSPGTYDLRLQGEGGAVCTNMGIVVAAASSWNIGQNSWQECIGNNNASTSE